MVTQLPAVVSGEPKMREGNAVVAKMRRDFTTLEIRELTGQLLEMQPLLAGLVASQVGRYVASGLVRRLQQGGLGESPRVFRQPDDAFVQLLQGQGADVGCLRIAQHLLRPDGTRQQQCPQPHDCVASVRVVLPSA